MDAPTHPPFPTFAYYGVTRRRLGYVCIACLGFTIVIPLLVTQLGPPGWHAKHLFWVSWEAVGIGVTAFLTLVFWLYECFFDKTPLPGRLSALCTLMVLLGGVFVCWAAGTAVNDGPPGYEAMCLALGTLCWSLNSYFVWQYNCHRVKRVKGEEHRIAADSARRYEGVFKLADLPAAIVFVVLLGFVCLLPGPSATDPWKSHRAHELRAFLAGVVAFQFMVANSAYVVEFWPWNPPKWLALNSKVAIDFLAVFRTPAPRKKRSSAPAVPPADPLSLTGNSADISATARSSEPLDAPVEPPDVA